MKNLIAILTSLVVLLISTGMANAAPISNEEKLLAQRVYLIFPPVTAEEMNSIANPSPLFNYIKGLRFIQLERYSDAKVALDTLVAKYPKSKVAQFYAALAKFGAARPGPAVQVIQAFLEHLYDTGDQQYFYKNKKSTQRFEDPLFSKIYTQYEFDKLDDPFASFRNKLETWFDALKEKHPEDFVILASYQVNTDLNKKIIDDGQAMFPNNALLQSCEVTGLEAWKQFRKCSKKGMKKSCFFSNKAVIDDEDKIKIRTMLRAYPDTAKYVIADVARTCDYASDSYKDAWDVFAPPLCEEELAKLKHISWKKLKPTKDITDDLARYYSANVEPYTHEQLSSAHRFWLGGYCGVRVSLYFLDLANRIITTAYDATQSGDYSTAFGYLEWNRHIYRALADKPSSYLNRMVQFKIAELTWKAELEIKKAQYPSKPSEWKRLEDNIDKLTRLLEFNENYVRKAPVFPAEGSYGMLYDTYIGSLPTWVDTAFAVR